jgi:hypothetical protein
MCNLSKKETLMFMTYQKFQKAMENKKIRHSDFNDENTTSMAFLTWAAAYAYTPNSELNLQIVKLIKSKIKIYPLQILETNK